MDTEDHDRMRERKTRPRSEWFAEMRRVWNEAPDPRTHETLMDRRCHLCQRTPAEAGQTKPCDPLCEDCRHRHRMNLPPAKKSDAPAQ